MSHPPGGFSCSLGGKWGVHSKACVPPNTEERTAALFRPGTGSLPWLPGWLSGARARVGAGAGLPDTGAQGALLCIQGSLVLSGCRGPAPPAPLDQAKSPKATEHH